MYIKKKEQKREFLTKQKIIVDVVGFNLILLFIIVVCKNQIVSNSNIFLFWQNVIHWICCNGYTDKYF